MSNVIVVGAQWGDEGKGKIVDWLSSRADVVVRFQGGHNAGHTLVIDGVQFKLSLLPSGVVRPGKLAVIGNGVVVDPWALLAEIERIQAQGVSVSPQNLYLAENAPLILPVHGMLDRARENAKGDSKIGTTGRGIGPAYEDKVGRRAIRVADLAERALLKDKIENMLSHHRPLLQALGAEVPDAAEMLAQLENVAPKILPFAKPVWLELDRLRREGKRMLFEGAQGTLLDIDHGTYPYVTSSNTVSAAASCGSGSSLGRQGHSHVLGIAKAYVTRVGSGPFPTEQDNDIGERIRERGREFGTVTGRKRRCGWFDAVLARQAIAVGGIDSIALTKLDVLDGLEEIKICTGYRWRGNQLDYLPAIQTAQAEIEPIYESFAGWNETTMGVRNMDDLPAAAKRYIDRLQQLIEVPISVLSTSPERDDTILCQDPFAKAA